MGLLPQDKLLDLPAAGTVTPAFDTTWQNPEYGLGTHPRLRDWMCVRFLAMVLIRQAGDLAGRSARRCGARFRTESFCPTGMMRSELLSSALVFLALLVTPLIAAREGPKSRRYLYLGSFLRYICNQIMHDYDAIGFASDETGLQ